MKRFSAASVASVPFTRARVARGLFLGGVALLAFALGGCQTATADGAAADSGAGTAGRDTGRPTVVFEAGLGDGASVWSQVAPAIANDTRIYTYSRRGYGVSLPALGDRSGARAIEELRERLRAEGLRPPYVLVGHSLGGLYVHLFAKLHPDEVAGLVLVDPTPPDHTTNMKAEQPAQYALLQTIRTLQVATTGGAEFRSLPETSRQWHAAPTPPCPAILLSAQQPQMGESAAFVAFKVRHQRELVAGTPSTQFRLVPDSGHYIQKERPALVIAAIREILTQTATAQK
ncbi:MAG: alpha/beta fold hydrolase [Opitutae bacterium]|nr:alpha/beta fold hydrolase [Opitutae bacterium]